MEQASREEPATARREARYTEWAPIAEGGSAKVYKVFDRELGIPLAIKILKHGHDPRHLESLRGEVLISRALRHPNICPVHDLYEGARGIGVIMDLLEGQTLATWLADHNARLLDTIAERLTLLRRITEALALAHTRIIHRDLKPANIFLRHGDIEQPLIMDFGLSAMVVHGERFAGGTPKYMAPEQYEAPQTVDQRADLFSLGILAYELLTGGRIPPCSLQQVMRTGEVPRVARSEIAPPSRFCSAVPPALDRLVLQMISRDKDDRPASAAEVEQALAGVALRDPFAADPADRRTERQPVAIPAGTYQIGSAQAEAAAWEKPVRRIRLSGCALNAHPVTNRQFRDFVAATGYRPPALLDDPQFGLDDAPVVMVTWDDACAYARWAGGRLPTEVEWEVAARSGEAERPYPWGSEAPSPLRANLAGDAPSRIDSHPAGVSPWGHHDLCGNVWEWCLDTWDADYYRSLGGDVLDPQGRSDGEQRVLRGGSFDCLAWMARSSARYRAPRGEARADIGFRIVFET